MRNHNLQIMENQREITDLSHHYDLAILQIEQQEFIITDLEEQAIEKENEVEYWEQENDFLMKKHTEGGDLLNKLNAKVANLDQVIKIQDQLIIESSIRYSKPEYVLSEEQRAKRGQKNIASIYHSKKYKPGRRFHFQFCDPEEKDIERILQFLPMPAPLDPPSPLSICEEVCEEEHVHYIER
jgi:hypothetical protein